MMKIANKITLILLTLVMLATTVTATPVSGCQDITSSGTYELTGPITGTGYCIHIKTGDVTIDCKGNNITGGYAIYLGQGSAGDITIKNCIIKNAYWAISGISPNPNIKNLNILNNMIKDSTRGITSHGRLISQNMSIINNTILDQTNEALYLAYSGTAQIINNTALRNGRTGGPWLYHTFSISGVNADKIIFDKNEVSDNQGLRSSGVLIRDIKEVNYGINYINGNGENGVNIANITKPFIIQDQNFYANGWNIAGYGIVIDQVTGVIIKNVTVDIANNTRGAGIKIIASNNTKVINSTIISETSGIYTTSKDVWTGSGFKTLHSHNTEIINNSLSIKESWAAIGGVGYNFSIINNLVGGGGTGWAGVEITTLSDIIFSDNTVRNIYLGPAVELIIANDSTAIVENNKVIDSAISDAYVFFKIVGENEGYYPDPGMIKKVVFNNNNVSNNWIRYDAWPANLGQGVLIKNVEELEYGINHINNNSRTGVQIENIVKPFTIENQEMKNNRGRCIYIVGDVTNVTLRNNKIKNCSTGIEVHAPFHGGPPSWPNKYTIVNNTKITDNIIKECGTAISLGRTRVGGVGITDQPKILNSLVANNKLINHSNGIAATTSDVGNISNNIVIGTNSGVCWPSQYIYEGGCGIQVKDNNFYIANNYVENFAVGLHTLVQNITIRNNNLTKNLKYAALNYFDDTSIVEDNTVTENGADNCGSGWLCKEHAVFTTGGYSDWHNNLQGKKLEIKNNDMSNNLGNGLTGGLLIQRLQQLDYGDNYINDNDDIGLRLTSINRSFAIENQEFYKNGGYALKIHDLPSHVIVTLDNIIAENNGGGIYLKSLEQVNYGTNHINYNNKNDTGIKIEDVQQPLTIENQELKNNSGYAIEIINTDNVTIRNVVIKDGSAGIHVQSSDYGIYDNNNITGNDGYGILLEGSSNNVLTNSYFLDNGNYGAAIINGEEYWDPVPSEYNLVYNNYFDNALNAYEEKAESGEGGWVECDDYCDGWCDGDCEGVLDGDCYQCHGTCDGNPSDGDYCWGICDGTCHWCWGSCDGICTGWCYGVCGAAEGPTNQWNSSIAGQTNIIGCHNIGGNYYSDYNRCDINGDCFGEQPYSISGTAENNDYLPLARTATEEVCDGVDNDCDGLVDGIYVCDQNLIGYWQFDETSGDIAFDSTLNNNHGTLIGDASHTEGKVNNSLSLDGNGDYVDIGTLNPITNKITISAWINPSSINYESIVSWGYWYEYVSLYLRPSNSETIRWIVNAGGTEKRLLANITHLDITDYTDLEGRWSHVVATYSPTEQSLYVDGVKVATREISNSNNIDFGSILHIGLLPVDEQLSFFFNGMLDEVAVYDRVLSEQEIIDQYNNGLGKHYCDFESVCEEGKESALDILKSLVKPYEKKKGRCISEICVQSSATGQTICEPKAGKELKSNTEFRDSLGNTGEFHTSCSRCIQIGDTDGVFEITSITDDGRLPAKCAGVKYDEDKKSQKELKKAIEYLTKSLGNRIEGGDKKIIWIDDTHIACKHGHKVFDHEKKAVYHLEKIKDPSILNEVNKAIDIMVNIDKTIAETAINGAPAGKDKDKAVKKFNKGEADTRNEHKIQEYRKAWKYINKHCEKDKKKKGCIEEITVQSPDGEYFTAIGDEVGHPETLFNDGDIDSTVKIHTSCSKCIYEGQMIDGWTITEILEDGRLAAKCSGRITGGVIIIGGEKILNSIIALVMGTLCIFAIVKLYK